ncbi:unnamed protein product [Adineta ricciae]|uniref:ATP receptor n=1 Tax=Adineta ricciae TaxID=249248 RepID=A0A813VWQ5_ADIRI|nr:unnamed protein product [Adineta ricciae]CAF1000111.1 unnamed protein product [Adineta ricciae]
MKLNSLFKHHHRARRIVTKGFYSLFTEYETPKLVLIHSSTLTILLRIMQIILLIYSILYLLLYEKGYQKQDTSIVSSFTLKVKGVGFVQTVTNETIIIDVADYIIPPSENDAIFIMSNFIQTSQTRSQCAEAVSLEEARCKVDDDCLNKAVSSKASGRWTGRCLITPSVGVMNTTANLTQQSTGLCEYAGWCPAENDEVQAMYVNDFLNFTIFIKNFIEFPTFRVKHKNMVDNLKTCIFHPKHSPDCPIFSLGYILNQAEKDPKERELMLRYGGVISIKLDWDCNLDRKINLCKPEYTFVRLDVPFREKPFSRGFNFRYASHWKYHGVNHRTLMKAYGLRLIMAVSGKAGKFDPITLSLNTGSLVGIFGLATFFCDIILLHLSKQSRNYRRHVFETVHLKTRTESIVGQRRNTANADVSTNSHLTVAHETIPRFVRRSTSLRPLTLADIERSPESQPV